MMIGSSATKVGTPEPPATESIATITPIASANASTRGTVRGNGCNVTYQAPATPGTDQFGYLLDVEPPVPPETGASSWGKPFSAANACTARASSTEMVELSMNRVPGVAAAITSA